MKTHRLARISAVIREVASETILFKLSDPRIQMVTVLRAEVSGDLQHAKVFVSIMGDDERQKETLIALNHASGFVQAQLADRMKTRFLPVLTFVLDLGVKKSLEVSRLIQEALANPSKISKDDILEADAVESETSDESFDETESQEFDGGPSEDKKKS